MHVLVDGIHLVAEAKGVGLYTKNVLEQLLLQDRSLELSILTLAGAPDPRLEAGLRYRLLPVAWRNHFWHGFRVLPAHLARLRPDVVWMPYEAPMAHLPVPYLMVCHDIPGEIRRAQEAGGGARRSLLGRLRDGLDDRLLGRTLGGAHTVFANSGYVADRLASDFGVDRRRIRLAPCAPGADFAALSRRVDVEAARRGLGLEDGYVLTFFTGDRRENPGMIPEVYDRLAAASVAEGLVVAGVKPENRAEVEGLFGDRPWRDRVRLVPFFGAAELFRLVETYSAATVYLDPSLHEGFGMQVIEAMACRTPVVSSDRGALPEVTGGAALLADPLNPEAIAGRILEVLKDPARQDELVARGVERASHFSWRRTAEVILAALREAAGGAAFG